MHDDRNFNKNLEGLRGLCAVVVAFTHLFGFNFFDSQKAAVYPSVMNFQFAHAAVLIFFLISGYVIGINHINTPCNYRNVVSYIKKRLVRLYPIYLGAIILSIAINYHFTSARQVAGHLLFLQEIITPTFTCDVVLWSLSYEFVYYVLFLALWAFNKYSKNYYFILIVLIMMGVACVRNYTVVMAIATGWIFWILGLYISRLPDDDRKKAAYKPLISNFLIVIATFDLGCGSFLMRVLHLRFTGQQQLVFDDVVYIPIATLIMIAVTGKFTRYSNILTALAYLIPALYVLKLILYKNDLLHTQNLLYGAGILVPALALLAFKINISIFEKLNNIGRMSYAIYVFHFPIALLVEQVLSRYLSFPAFFIMGTFAWVVLSYAFSYLAELVLQPRIKKYFFKKPPALIRLPANQ